MNWHGWLELSVFLALLALLTWPVGRYLEVVMDPAGRTWLDPVFKPVERFVYRILRVDAGKEQNWKAYALSLFVFSAAATLFTYACLRLQHGLPLNPEDFGNVSPALAFNTAVSFATNTNWQSYAGETTLSIFSQMVGLVFQNFVSAAVGIAVAAALVRGIARRSAKTIGHFWVDLVRINLYLLLPLSFILAIFLVSQGVPQSFGPDVKATGVEDRPQTILEGPVASQEAIKMLGTNGGGYTNANSAHPFENPTPLSNFVEILSIFLIPAGLTVYLGRSVRRPGHGWTLWGVMAVLFAAGTLLCWHAEVVGNPRLTALGLTPSANMEGKEVRFGPFGSALFTTATTDASCGAVNSMLDSYTPLGGLVPLANIQLGEVIFGGVGAGLYGMLIFVILTVFLAGLMVGRSPEYLGKKIEAYEVKLSVVFLLVTLFLILGFSACAAASAWGKAGLLNHGPHGLSEILYAFSSAAGNNGSAFAGLNTATLAYELTMAAAMLAGRFLVILPVLALAGSLAGKTALPEGPGTFPVVGVTFGFLLLGTILIVGALTFLPALTLGPILEHFLLIASKAAF